MSKLVPRTISKLVPRTISKLVPRTISKLVPRIAEMAAIFMVGDGLVALIQPHRHVELWKDGALGAEKTVAPFVGRPGRRRLYALAQIGAGLLLASRQRPS